MNQKYETSQMMLLPLGYYLEYLRLIKYTFIEKTTMICSVETSLELV